MGFTPPKHGFEGSVQLVVRGLDWSPVTGDIGQVSGGWLAIASDDATAARWVAGAQAAPEGIAPRFIAKDAWTALRDGTIAPDGTITWSGRRFRLADVLEDGRMVARLAPVT
jgi:hypothetical protein